MYLGKMGIEPSKVAITTGCRQKQAQPGKDKVHGVDCMVLVRLRGEEEKS